MRYVLIADDHEVVRRGLRDILRDAFGNLEVFEAGDAAAVLSQLEAHSWDLILLDLMMPGGSTPDLVRSIRALHRRVPILILTAATELAHVPQAMRAGANGLIHKHRAADVLVEAIRAVTRGESYLHPETAIALATALPRDDASEPHASLSTRELEIFRLIAVGKSVKEIAAELVLSDKTVATYLTRIREKTGLASHVDIARYALQHGLVH